MHHPEHVVSPETIYQGAACLIVVRCAALWPRSCAPGERGGSPHRRKGRRVTRYIDPGRLIGERPEEAEDRVPAGHWEGDWITGSGNVTAIGPWSNRPAATSSSFTQFRSAEGVFPRFHAA